MLPITLMERESAIHWYLQNQQAMLAAKHVTTEKDYRITYERYSSAFVDAVSVRLDGVDSPDDNLKAQVVSTVWPEWNQWSQTVIAELTARGLWQGKYLRGGGAYMSNIQAKRLDKWFTQRRTLIQDVPKLWLRSYYQEDVLPQVLTFLKGTRDRLEYNLERASKHPELLLGNKPPTTGTGLKEERISTRQLAAENFPLYAEKYREQLFPYWDALTEAIGKWPMMGAIVDTGPLFKGAQGGRSDADYELLPDGSIRTRCKCRSVGPGFESLLSNNLMNPKEYRRTLIEQISSPYAVRPWDSKGIAEIVLLPDATLDGPSTEQVVLSADLGYCNTTRTVRPGGGVELGTETDSFGADGVLGSGIFIRTRYGPVYAFLLSGMVITQDIYIVMMSNIIAAWAHRERISPKSLRWTQIGDDIHFAVDRDLLPRFLTEFGNYLKLKGMYVEGDWVGHFFLGQYIWRKKEGDDVIMAIYPRAIKSETSAKANLSVEFPEAKIGQTIRMEVPGDAKAAATDTLQRYPELFFYHGTTEGAKTVITRDIIRARLELARAGISDWAAEDPLEPDDLQDPLATGPGANPIVTEIAPVGATLILEPKTDGAGTVSGTTSAVSANEDEESLMTEEEFAAVVEKLKTMLDPAAYAEFEKAWKAHERWHDAKLKEAGHAPERTEVEERPTTTEPVVVETPSAGLQATGMKPGGQKIADKNSPVSSEGKLPVEKSIVGPAGGHR